VIGNVRSSTTLGTGTMAGHGKAIKATTVSTNGISEQNAQGGAAAAGVAQGTAVAVAPGGIGMAESSGRISTGINLRAIVRILKKQCFSVILASVAALSFVHCAIVRLHQRFLCVLQLAAAVLR
jgi:hypothetical protein